MDLRKCFTCSVIYCALLVCVRVAATANDVGLEENLEKNRWKVFESNLKRDEESYRVASNFGEYMEERIELIFTNECSRYCIKNGTDKNENEFQFIYLSWTANELDDNLSNSILRLESEKKLTDKKDSFSDSSRKCQIYLDLNCYATEAGTAANNKNNASKSFDKHGSQFVVKLAEKHNLRESTEIEFMVNTAMRRILINIDGNVSNAVLRIPSGTNATTSNGGETTIRWTRKNDADWLKLDIEDPPPGEWWLKLARVNNWEYHLDVQGFIDEDEAVELFSSEPIGQSDLTTIRTNRQNIKIKSDTTLNKFKKSDDLIQITDAEVIGFEKHNSDATENPKLEKVRSLERRRIVEENEQAENEESKDNSSTENAIINYAEYVTLTSDDKNSSASKTINNNDKFLRKMFSTEEQGQIRARSSIDAVENFDVNTEANPNSLELSVKSIETLDNDGLSKEEVNYANENTIEGKKLLIEVNRNSNLLAQPGTIHRIVFDVINSCILPVRYAFNARSTVFRIYNIQPRYTWVYPGQTSNVAVDLIVPDNAGPDTANQVTFNILGTEIKEKSVYLYVQGSVSKLTDDVKPKIDYSFNNNCAGKLDKNRCHKSRWSMDVTIEDYDSGLKRVVSSPSGIYPRTEFISGTRSPVTFYYSATCCDTTAKITAVDLLDNYNTYTIDVTVWNNLSEAEVAAITVGALLVLLLIILIIILIIYCVRRKKSHDLPYTQRYGSRSPASAERSNF